MLFSTPKGIVLLTSWLRSNDYSPDLVKRYRNSGWLESIGFGANIRSGDNVDCFAGLYSLQEQCGSSIHVAARSAFSIQGKSHYLEFNTKKIILFATNKDRKLPEWFKNFDWGIEFEIHSSNFLPADLGVLHFPIKEFSVKISGEIRAFMECLYLIPNYQELTECYELMEGMNNLHPKKVQELLCNCNSIKVKRLFLYLAEKVGHEWFNYLDLSNIDLGSGKRKIVEDGVFDKKYKITVPKFWKSNDRRVHIFFFIRTNTQSNCS
ncbi:MAG TPA: type IV toxin-antitoxin system AbiEi family antitoxin domain-containing protein [Candidatus Megaira endosymbiont of Nemacystus decipiens]|nr:type IV toxin-antitoxin system AbiEi family antitoxin domain-containing protein [Candidatus Megaera endosymbiont of Nemacystus decipiens]